MLNQIIYTFDHSDLMVLEKKHGNSWSWSHESYSYLNPTLRREYGGNVVAMLGNQLTDRILKVLWLSFVFGSISIIIALFIRITAKSLELFVFPQILYNNRSGQDDSEQAV